MELSALPLLIIALTALAQRDLASEHRFALLVLGGVVMTPLLQLLPLPPAIWTSLPGRDQLVLGLRVADLPQGWLPLSFSPDRTWRSFLALIPPVAMFVGVLVSGSITRVRLIQALILATCAAIVLGTAQLASGGQQLYPWETTFTGSVTGFFANRNHFATLCLIGLPFATVLGAGTLRRGGAGSRLPLWLAILYIALAVVALGVVRSRAGIILFGPVLMASFVAAWVAGGRGRPKPLLLGLAGGAAAAVGAVGAFALGPIVSRFGAGGAPEGRFENWSTVLQAADAHLPLGSGVGSFDTIYRSVEPLERLDSTYFNQAHNDYLETALETGWIGIALIIAFFVWFCLRSWAAWRAKASTQRDLQRAATIAVGIVILHSTADYPLRTATLATIFALCCGVLELASRSDAGLDPDVSSRRRRAREHRSALS